MSLADNIVNALGKRFYNYNEVRRVDALAIINEQLETQNKIIELYEKQCAFYGDTEKWYIERINRNDVETYNHKDWEALKGGKLARETQKQVDELRRGCLWLRKSVKL